MQFFPAPLYYAYLKLKQIIMFSCFFQRKGSLEKQKKFSCTKIFSTGRSAGRQTVHQRVDLWHHADYQHLVNVQVAEQTQNNPATHMLLILIIYTLAMSSNHTTDI